jgi:uncharacterized protein
VGKYFAPAFQITVNGSRLSADVSKNIEQVQVVSKPDTIDTFSLTIANALPKLRWTHTSDADLFREGHWVTIKLGYVDDLQQMMSGEITHIQPTFPDSGVPTVTIEGQSLLHRLQGDHQTRTFQHKTDRQIAQQIGEEAHLSVDAEDTGAPLDYVIQANKTDLEFLKERASSLHFEILVADKTLIFRKAKESAKKIYTLLWAQSQKSFASGSTTLPLKSFSPQLNTKKPANQVEYRSYDHKTKQAFVVRAGVQDQPSKMGGTQAGADVAAAAFQQERKRAYVTSPFASEAEGKLMAKATYNESAMEFVTGRAETIGIPDLRSGCVVELQGVGPRFSGEYYLDEVTHAVGGGGYQTSLSVKRNSTS